MKRLFLFLIFAGGLAAQSGVAWKATSGTVSLSAAGTTVTFQQPATNANQQYIDKIVVYCSVACAVTQAANGTAATATAGTISPVLPSQLNTTINATFWTASNVGTGTDQAGITNIPAGSPFVFCLSPSCGNNAQVVLGTGGTGNNYSVTIGSITGSVVITFFGRQL